MSSSAAFLFVSILGHKLAWKQYAYGQKLLNFECETCFIGYNSRSKKSFWSLKKAHC